MTDLIRRATAECIGTFAIVFFGCGAIIMQSFPDARYGVLGIGLITAVVYAVAVSMTMGISGGHLNPAVTLGMLVTGRIDLPTAGGHIGGQLVGAVAAGWAAGQLYPANVGVLANWGTPAISPQLTFGGAVAIEALLAFFLMSAVMGTIVSKRAPQVGGFAVGLTLLFATMTAMPLSGAVLNPARAFGPALISGSWTAQAVWWVGPILGAVLAALVWHHVLLKEEE